LGSTLAAGAAVALPSAAMAAQDTPQEKTKRYQGGISPWPLVLNASTIRPAPLQDKLTATAGAGWDGIELWIDDLEKHEKDGGNLKDLAKQIRDMGLFVPNIIGLWNCMPPTQEAFDASLPETRERMRRSAEVGSEFVAAIPAPDREDFDMAWGSHCYRELMRIGRDDYNIKVAFEFVGFFKGIHRLGQAAGVAIDTNDPAACLIMDTFHLFRGDSGFNGIKLIQPELIADFHWNDVPGDIPREKQGDEHRIYPGDGVLPLVQALKDLKAINYRRTLSLEIFCRKYWEQDPKQVAADGLRKMRECVAKAEV
jgi:sugar phosphate isomerase/epimerase